MSTDSRSNSSSEDGRPFPDLPVDVTPEALESSDVDHAWDAKLRAALQDVPVPSGLEDRLLAQLERATGPNRAELPAYDRPHGRRHWLLASVSAAVVFLLVAGGVLAWRWTGPRVLSPVSSEELASAATQWQEQLSSDWISMDSPPPADRPMDRRVQVRARGWQVLATKYDPQAIALDLRSGRGSAWLFVVGTQAPFLADTQRCERLPATGGWAVGAWQAGPCVYVLVIREEGQRLDDFFSPRSTPVAQGRFEPVAVG